MGQECTKPAVTPDAEAIGGYPCVAPYAGSDDDPTGLEQPATKQSGTSGSGVLPMSDMGRALKDMQKRYPYLASPTHELHEWVNKCDLAVRAGDEAAARDALARIEQAVEQEEKALSAAFNLFKPPTVEYLTDKEVKTMLKYLGFPHDPADVAAVLKATDSDGDGKMSLVEFQGYVGKMGGSFKLFEVRRKQMTEKHGRSMAGGSGKDPVMLSEDLKQAGILEESQAYWRVVLPPSEFEEAGKLVACQQRALRTIRTLAKSNHDQALISLQRRVASLGFQDNDLWMALGWIRELAPILVHVNLDKMMQFMEKDTHYRNQFETASSGGLLKPAVREKWERDLFGGAYNGAKGFDRCKYGVLNAMNDYRGVVKCAQYGDSYIVLKDVRLRCTFSPEDSANLKAERLAVLDFYGHVLNEYSDQELKETLKIAKSSEAALLGDSSKVGAMKYKEAQLHGEIAFGKHVERLVANVRHRATQGGRVKALCAKHGWNFSWMDQERDRMKSEEMHHLGEDAFKAKMKAIMDRGVPDAADVPPGCCRKGCGRKVAPGKTAAGKDFTTCCRGCALGFGHDLLCGQIDASKVGPGLCSNGCGRPVNPGKTGAGRPYTTCCRGCARNKHDPSCVGEGGGGETNDAPDACKVCFTRKVAPPSGGRTYSTCCRQCAMTNGAEHGPTCAG